MTASSTRDRDVTEARGLAGRLTAHLAETSVLPERAVVTLGLSGGVDSMVLLDLLTTLQPHWGWRLGAAHFDHRMRRSSGEEAEWVRAFCARRDIPCRVGRAPVVPRNETQARTLRYRFLHEARGDLGDGWLVTAHQADDQAETVLFRLLRGTGLRGLAGIPARREPRLVRPLLPFWRSELLAHARERGLEYLSDPSNLDLVRARNRIRHQLIPQLEAAGESDLRPQLVRLSELAGRATRVVDRLAERESNRWVLEASEQHIVVARTPFLAYDTAVQAHLLRALAARVGPRPGRVGTRTALEFIKLCPSGRTIQLAGGTLLRREFDRLLIERGPRANVAEQTLLVEGARDGEGIVRLGGVTWRVSWAHRFEGGGIAGRSEAESRGEESAWFDPAQLRFPVMVRSWRPGDRIRVPAGRRKLKKAFVDRKVGLSERSSFPVLADAAGVLWVVGLLRGIDALKDPEADFLGFRFHRES